MLSDASWREDLETLWISITLLRYFQSCLLQGNEWRATTGDQTRDTQFQIPNANHSTIADSCQTNDLRNILYRTLFCISHMKFEALLEQAKLVSFHYIIIYILSNYLNGATLPGILHFDAAAAEKSWKHCGKKRNCS